MKLKINFLTLFIALLFISGTSFSQVLNQSSNKSHLRWKIFSSKDLIKVSKKLNRVTIQSLDPDFFEKFSADVAKLQKNSTYHNDFKFEQPKVPGAPYKLMIDLTDDTIELFSFYKADEQGYFLDFWINQDVVATKEASAKSKLKLAKLNSKPKKKNISKKKPVKKNRSVESTFKVKSDRVKFIDPSKIEKITHTGFRDFRYGAAFIWDYSAEVPPLEMDLSLKEKAPDYFYKVEDRKLLDDKKEAHLQLSINFYNKEEWGLMTRSVNLYEEKYGKDKNKPLLDFMKAVSMLKNTIKRKLKPEFQSKIDEAGEIIPPEDYSLKGVRAAARNLLTGVIESSENYELNKATLRYLIQYARNEEDHIQSLNLAKKLYVKASEAFDDEMIVLSSRIILNSLAHLRQLDKIKSFLENKAVMRVLPKQEGMAYISFVNLLQGKTSQVIADFKVNKAKLANPIHSSILFNVAEAFFREAKYEDTIKLFDEYLDKYSFQFKASQARLRLALSYDLLDKDPKMVMELYKNAINKASDIEVRYEAKLRYVGMRVGRKINPTEQDLETIVFLNADAAEKGKIHDDLKQLLWLTRLRSFISGKKYSEALAYLTSLPIENIRRVKQRTFNADGSEIVLGLIKNSYLKDEYSKVVKVWEVYKDKYETTVAKNPYMNFIVADSYINLRLFSSYQRAIKGIEGLSESKVRRFPMWVTPHKNIKLDDYLVELNLNYLLEQDKYKELNSFLEQNKGNKNINYKFYKGLVWYKLKNYNTSVASFESLLVNPNINNILSPKQNLMMLKAYLESLYESAGSKSFREKSLAISSDLKRNQGKEYLEVTSRADYLYIESLYSEGNIDYKLLKLKSNDFLTNFKTSSYKDRVTYLNGLAKIKTDEVDGGKKLLEDLLNNKETPEYLKGLARSELTSLTLKSKTL